MALALVATLLSLAAIEFGYRLASGRPVLALKDWRTERVEHSTFGDRAIYDPVFGWTLKAGYTSNGYNTLDHGIRRNFNETTIRTGAILAVGDSFTDGWTDVHDDGTWPSHLERLTGMPVLNGGVGGYATDQTIMRAEKLLPLVRPKMLIVGFLDEDISRSGHSSFGASKPYFTLEQGALRYHPPQHMDTGQQAGWRVGARTVLGYSAVLDLVLGRLAYGYWYGSAGEEVFRPIDNNPVGVTCALLQRLKTTADAADVRVRLFMQYGWETIAGQEQPTKDAQWVMDCARMVGIEVIDQFASLRALAVGDPAALRDIYVKDGDSYGHMSSRGNAHAANLIATALIK